MKDNRGDEINAVELLQTARVLGLECGAVVELLLELLIINKVTVAEIHDWASLDTIDMR